MNTENYSYEEVKELKYNSLVKLAKSIEIEFKMQKKPILQDKVLLKLGLIKVSEIVIPKSEKELKKDARSLQLDKIELIKNSSLSKVEKIKELNKLTLSNWKIKTILGLDYEEIKKVLGTSIPKEDKNFIEDLSEDQVKITQDDNLTLENKVKKLYEMGIAKWKIARIFKIKYSELPKLN